MGAKAPARAALCGSIKGPVCKKSSTSMQEPALKDDLRGSSTPTDAQSATGSKNMGPAQLMPEAGTGRSGLDSARGDVERPEWLAPSTGAAEPGCAKLRGDVSESEVVLSNTNESKSKRTRPQARIELPICPRFLKSGANPVWAPSTTSGGMPTLAEL